MLTLKEFKEVFDRFTPSNLQKENQEPFIQNYLRQNSSGNPEMHINFNGKYTKIMNGEVLPGVDVISAAKYFMQEENRQYVYTTFHKVYEKITDMVGFVNALKDMLSKLDNKDPFYGGLLGVLKASNQINAVTLVSEWIYIAAFLNSEIDLLEDKYRRDFLPYSKSENVSSETKSVLDYLYENDVITSTVKMNVEQNMLCETVPIDLFFKLRRKLIDSACGKLYIAGETLSDAFSISLNSHASIIQNIVAAVNSGRLKEINLFYIDPSVFGEDAKLEPAQSCRYSVINAINQLSQPLENMEAKLKIFFLPYIDIDHAVLTDEFLLYRSTKVLMNDRDKYKGSMMIYSKNHRINLEVKENNDVQTKVDYGEYFAHKMFLDSIMNNAVYIDTKLKYLSDEELPEDISIHQDIRNTVNKLLSKGNSSVELYKVYNSQMVRNSISSFEADHSRFTFHYNKTVKNRDDLFKKETFIGDRTQETLLGYLKKTEELLNSVVKRYDKRKESGAVIIPSLDLGYPNNIMRLAGGFATGMLVDWECGTPIIPIDATVNVCTSSVFRINPSEELLKDFESFRKRLERVFYLASENFGYSFSFLSGNHFLMLAQDEKGEYYLVMHSSVKEMKESYFGLYPTESNWFSSKQKYTIPEPLKSGKRYLRYIKGKEAEYFIQTAHHLEKYNEEIHEWLAVCLNNGHEIDASDNGKLIKHHYYMPTDNSIAIGTFVEKPNTVVPLFSNVGKPVYLFKIGKDNVTYNLGGRKGKVCIVPHGWGQQIENVNEITHKSGQLVLKTIDGKSIDYEIKSKTRLDNRVEKQIRDFKDGNEFLQKGNNILKGEIVKTLTPIHLYCHDTIVRDE